MRIEQYDLANTSKERLVLDERVFRGLGERVRAVSLFEHRLEPGAVTQLFVVRGGS